MTEQNKPENQNLKLLASLTIGPIVALTVGRIIGFMIEQGSELDSFVTGCLFVPIPLWVLIGLIFYMFVLYE